MPGNSSAANDRHGRHGPLDGCGGRRGGPQCGQNLAGVPGGQGENLFFFIFSSFVFLSLFKLSPLPYIYSAYTYVHFCHNKSFLCTFPMSVFYTCFMIVF